MPSISLLLKAFLSGLPYLLMAFALGLGWRMFMKRKHPDRNGIFLSPLFQNRRGLSLAFILVLSTIALVIGSRMVNRSVKAKLRAVDMFRSVQAEYAAQDALRWAFSEAKLAGIGHENEEETLEIGDTNADGKIDVFASYTIVSRSKPLDWQTKSSPCDAFDHECFVPIPGTGSVGTGIPGKKCDFEDSSEAWVTDFEDGCNWNRIDFGETVLIPLHYVYNPEDMSISCSDGFCDPKDTFLNIFSLRVRTPEDPNNGSPYTLDASTDPAIVNWEIDGKCKGGGGDGCYLIGMATGEEVMGGFEEDPVDSYIRASTINSPIGPNHEVLNMDSQGQDAQGNEKILISEFLRAEYFDDLTEPFLKLSVVSPLKAFDGGSVPYLEYQIVTDKAISDSKWVYTALGKAEGKLGMYVFPMTATQSIGLEPVINFVVQH